MSSSSSSSESSLPHSTLFPKTNLSLKPSKMLFKALSSITTSLLFTQTSPYVINNVYGADNIERFLLVSSPTLGEISFIRYDPIAHDYDAPKILLSGLDTPHGLCIDRTRGRLFVTDNTAKILYYTLKVDTSKSPHKLSLVTPDPQLAAQNVKSKFCDVDGLGNLYFSEISTGQIRRVSNEQLNLDNAYAIGSESTFSGSGSGSGSDSGSGSGSSGSAGSAGSTLYSVGSFSGFGSNAPTESEVLYQITKNPDGITPPSSTDYIGNNLPTGIASDGFHVYFATGSEGLNGAGLYGQKVGGKIYRGTDGSLNTAISGNGKTPSVSGVSVPSGGRGDPSSVKILGDNHDIDSHDFSTSGLCYTGSGYLFYTGYNELNPSSYVTQRNLYGIDINGDVSALIDPNSISGGGGNNGMQTLSSHPKTSVVHARFPSGAFQKPRDCTWDQDGLVFLADEGAGKIYSFPGNIDNRMDMMMDSGSGVTGGNFDHIVPSYSKNEVGSITQPFGVAVWSDVKNGERSFGVMRYLNFGVTRYWYTCFFLGLLQAVISFISIYG